MKITIVESGLKTVKFGVVELSIKSFCLISFDLYHSQMEDMMEYEIGIRRMSIQFNYIQYSI